MSFETVLIANRGEIALRVMRTARSMGYRCVTVHTASDADAPHVRAADRAVLVPSYLDGAAILAAAKTTGAGALHPGYGYLSENAAFARNCADEGVVFIGPTPEAIALMGEKGAAKHAAEAAGVPCLPGYADEAQDENTLLAEGERIGAPLMVKAAFGGGGKGMRLVHDLADLPEALSRAASEALKAFGDGALILERALLAPRHIEVQVFGDAHGTVVHLGERECSVQRRHQKVIEEAPSPAVTPELRAQLGAAAVALAKASGYVGAGTVEFLLDDGAFWFLEMNARLQVEHPVTEAVTGLDLVDWQIRVARGEPLPLAQDQIAMTGHAIEARLYAEDPAQGFLPQTGSVLRWRPDDELRVDHALEEGQEIGGDFDPMLAKLIASGPDRDTARRRLIAGLDRTELLGFHSNRVFLSHVLRHPVFAAGQATTQFLGSDFIGDPSLIPAAPDPAILALAVLVNAGAPALRFGFSNGPAPVLTRRFEDTSGVHSVTATLGPGNRATVRNGPEVVLHTLSDGLARASIDGVAQSIPVASQGGTLCLGPLILRDVTLAPADTTATGSDGLVNAPMAGGVLQVAVAEQDAVTKGQVLAVLEAMKMEHPLCAPFDGRVIHVAVKAGSQVRARQTLFEIQPEDT